MTVSTYLFVLKVADQSTIVNGITAICAQADTQADALMLAQACVPGLPTTVLADANVSVLGTGVVQDTGGMSFQIGITTFGAEYVFTQNGGTGLQWSDVGAAMVTQLQVLYPQVTWNVEDNTITFPSSMNLGSAAIQAGIFVGEVIQPGLAPVVDGASSNDPATEITITLPANGNYNRVFFFGSLKYPGPPYFTNTVSFGVY